MHEPPKPAQDAASTADGWSAYHAATRDRPPRPLLLRALAFQPAPGSALDLGCGAGIDTRHLLELGYAVTAVDADPQAIDALAGLGHSRLTTVVSTFAGFTFDSAGYDLINAQFALPFNAPDTFDEMFARLAGSLRPGGILTGQLFGERDSWNESGSGLTFHTRAQAESLLAGLEVLVFEEIEKMGKSALGDDHLWHLFDIIARSPRDR